MVCTAEANKAFREKEYQRAIHIYKKLSTQGDILKRIANTNLSLMRRRLSSQLDFNSEFLKNSNLSPLVDSLKLNSDNLIIAYPIIPWEFRIQRPQHLIARLCKHGYTSIYLENFSPPTFPLSDEEIIDNLCTRELVSGVYEVSLKTDQGFNIYKTKLCGINLEEMSWQLSIICKYLNPKKIIHLVQFPGWTPLVEKIQKLCGGIIVYDCMDHHAGFTNNTTDALSQEEQLIRNADLVIASSLMLEKELRAKAKEVVLIKNGTDFKFFKKNKPNGKLDHLKGPIIGYHGAISHWFDIDLVVECAKQRPDWSFVLIGSTEFCDTSLAKKVKNIHFLGEIPYRALPGYLSYFDVCIIPFKITPLTEATNPVKFYEYISAAKPVVSTELPELQPYSEFIYFATNPKQFIEKIEMAYSNRNILSIVERLYECAKKNDWDDRVQALLSHKLFSLKSLQNEMISQRSLEVKEISLKEVEQLRHWVEIKDKEIIELRRWVKERDGEISRLRQQIAVGDITWEQFNNEILSKRHKYRGVFIQELTIDWNVPLFQRPQHISTAFGRLGYLVIYKTGNWGNGDHINGVRKVAENVWITSLDEANYIDNAVHSTYSTAYATRPHEIINKSPNSVIIYEYIDHIDPDISGADNIESLLSIKKWALSGGADYVVASARNLYEEIITEIGPEKVLYVPNGVDTKHYRSLVHDAFELPSEYINFRAKYNHIVGYFGAIAPWLWYEMLSDLVQVNRNVGFVFIGPDYYNGLEKLPRCENLLYLGSVEYNVLPSYAKLFDVCFIPFVPGDIAKSTSPLKLFEYFALEKPVVVTSEMAECIVYDEVLSGNDVNSISKAIMQAIILKDNGEFKEKLRKLADDNDWLERAKVMEKCFERLKFMPLNTS